ncbi:EamA family transporter [Coleofasciculus sp. FACHB-64]|uniref:EamA family transporter n=1 Tax=Cyanophyceae TaxID=3028117 RepID=UPI00168971B7|nr:MULTISPECIES: EamA family transporter [unclassified Coleofasciculus]MBD1837506.1 EamA family transporter [Coleofasciculus sp. FACHB-501]MBD1941937.1 EamA family transporter [Coleofasciculus sp. FACHB-712]MBD2047333.1 EamA family transporter [Coleofasciculus sp. FACHB-64]MBD2085321.1 EamA family transporter [Coleofasciculus sp. FACHB-542]MBD2540484.1 EamA family transporter [Coleofasciculus sp. FACHB-SPT36]
MGQLDNLPENHNTGNATATEALLRAMTQELENLKQNLIVQLNQDVERLQAEKSRLVDEINHLQAQRQQLPSSQSSLPQEQIDQDQQQYLVGQLTQAIAEHLQDLLMQRLSQQPGSSYHPLGGTSSANLPPSANDYNDSAYRILSSLDTTLRTTFKTLQQDISSYQSSFSQQLSRMHGLEQQGEAILETLVNRLHEQLQAESDALPLVPSESEVGGQAYSDRKQPPEANAIPFSVPAAPLPPPRQPKPSSQGQLGLLLILISTVALSVHNVVVQIIGRESQIFNLFSLGGFIKLGLGNSLLILWFRMMVVLPLMALLAIVLYPNVWRDIKKFLLDPDRRGLLTVVGSGFFLFLSQVLIYIAIPQIGPGVAVTILFMYPIITVPLAWLFFGDRPTFLRVGVMCTISLGVILAAWPKIFPAVNSGVASISGVGVGTAAASGIAFAFYLIFMQLGFQKLHPVPVSLVQFTTIFVLASISLMLPLPENLAVQVIPDKRLGLIIGGVVLGILTLAGYLLNNFGVRFLGAARASIIASSGPVLTAVLAFLIIPSAQNALQPISIFGIVLVTLGVFALSFERLLVQNKAQPAK